MNTENFDICLLILKKLKEKNLTVAWLARQIGSDGGNLRRNLNNNRDIYTALLYKISVAQKEDFFCPLFREIEKNNSSLLLQGKLLFNANRAL